MAKVASNADAVDAGLLFASGLHTFVAIFGPSGWGKSHLLMSVVNRMAQDGLPIPEIVSGDRLGGGLPARADLSAPLIVDNLDDGCIRPRTRVPLRLMLERRVKAGKPTLLAFAAPCYTRLHRQLLPMEREWFKVEIAAPTTSERATIIRQMASTESLQLSPVLVRLLSHRIQGDGRTLLGALKRLRLAGSNWQDRRAILHACSVLNPFLSDNANWDLRHRIARAVEFSRPEEIGVSSSDLAIYTMLREAKLGEEDVARYFGLSPSEAYLRAIGFEQAAQTDPRVRKALDFCIEAAIESLPRE